MGSLARKRAGDPSIFALSGDAREDARIHEIIGDAAVMLVKRNAATQAVPYFARLIPLLLEQSQNAGTASNALWLSIDAMTVANEAEYLLDHLPDMLQRLDNPDVLNAVSEIAKAIIHADSNSGLIERYLKMIDLTTEDGRFLVNHLLLDIRQLGNKTHLGPVRERMPMLKQIWRKREVNTVWLIAALGSAIWTLHGEWSREFHEFEVTFPGFDLDRVRNKVMPTESIVKGRKFVMSVAVLKWILKHAFGEKWADKHIERVEEGIRIVLQLG